MIACIALMGLAGGIDRIGSRGAPPTWVEYWVAVLKVSVYAGPLRWYFGRAWYRVRLGYAGALSVDVGRANGLFAISELVMVVPIVLVTILHSIAWPSPIEQPFGPILLVSMGWSLFVSYRGACAAFSLSVWRARAWFLVVPSLLYGALITWQLRAALW